jgi:1-deoxy-D-xylulose-5-phosphate synthase
MPEASYPLLDRVSEPADLRKFTADELVQLAAELREFLIQTVSTRGGHFAAGLGTVELTIALHHVYDTPDDRIVWDVGHQAYPHKVLTGRRADLHTIKQQGGLSPFPNRDESRFDTFGTGHSSTSISAALGMAVAAARKQEDRRAVAVIGDGAMSGGMAFEALNHAGTLPVDLLVILNDNEMSISEGVGALKAYFGRVLAGRFYTKLRKGGKKVLSQMPTMRKLAGRYEEHMKGMMLPGTMFEEMGFNYIGPIDGHDMKALVAALTNIRELKGPQFLHVVTTKGKGYAPAEADPIAWHGPGPFDPSSGTIFKEKTAAPTYSRIFGDWLGDAATADPRVIGITPAMREGSGLVEFSKRFPDRYFDVAIAEQHAVTFAAGMATEGLKPVVAIYSTFLQRGYDQLIHDVALQNLPVVFALDRAGLVGGDGATHQGSFDISFLRCIPNLVVMAPSDESECRKMLQTALSLEQPAAVRYPRGSGTGAKLQPELLTVPVGRSQQRREGRSGLAIFSFGPLLPAALAAAEELDATVLDMRFIKPLDADAVLRLALKSNALVTLEENVVAGGAGSAIGELLAEAGVLVPMLSIGIPDRFIEHGSRDDCLAAADLDATSVRRRISEWWRSLRAKQPQAAARV